MKESVTASASGSTESAQKKVTAQAAIRKPRRPCARHISALIDGRPARAQITNENIAPNR